MNGLRSSLAILSVLLLLCEGVGCSSGGGGSETDSGKIRMASLQNKAGKFIEPSIVSGQKALASEKLPEDLIAWIPNPAGEEAYPIVTYTWIIAYKKYPDAQKANSLKDVLTYCLTEGQKTSESLGYIPLPEEVVEKDKAALANIKGEGDVKDGKGQILLHGPGPASPPRCTTSGSRRTVRSIPARWSTTSRLAAARA